MDTSTYLFRNFVMIPPTIVLPGTKQPANALYGLLQTLARFVSHWKIERIVNVLDDVAADDERIALEPAYKATRREFPEGLASQCGYLEEALAAAGFASLIVNGWEADDVIGTVARLEHERKEPVRIVGIDKDLLQVLQPGDAMIDYQRDRERVVPYEEANQVLGVSAERTADFLALNGDSVDAIEGVPGVGKKTAALLVNALGGIDRIYANLDAVLEVEGLRGAAKVRASLAAHEEGARRALTLATLKTNAPVKLAEWRFRGTTEEGRRVLRDKFGFERLSERLPRAD